MVVKLVEWDLNGGVMVPGATAWWYGRGRQWCIDSLWWVQYIRIGRGAKGSGKVDCDSVWLEVTAKVTENGDGSVRKVVMEGVLGGDGSVREVVTEGCIFMCKI